MIPIGDTQPAVSRVDDDDQEFFDMYPIDDDAEFENFYPEPGESDGRTANQERVPVWRLIEMTRENRALKSSMADFADYEDLTDYEDFDGDLADEFSN